MNFIPAALTCLLTTIVAQCLAHINCAAVGKWVSSSYSSSCWVRVKPSCDRHDSHECPHSCLESGDAAFFEVPRWYLWMRSFGSLCIYRLADYLRHIVCQWTEANCSFPRNEIRNTAHHRCAPENVTVITDKDGADRKFPLVYLGVEPSPKNKKEVWEHGVSMTHKLYSFSFDVVFFLKKKTLTPLHLWVIVCNYCMIHPKINSKHFIISKLGWLFVMSWFCWGFFFFLPQYCSWKHNNS